MSKFWDEHAPKIDLDNFRGHHQYLWLSGSPVQAMRDHVVAEGLGPLISNFKEDDAFGCQTTMINGHVVSRDLLDSILEIDFLDRALPALGSREHVKDIVDIGAGYGRLVHRLHQFNPGLNLCATDAIDVSLEACKRYLNFRDVRTCVVESADVTRAMSGFDLAINVHSFPECTRDEVAAWIEWLREIRVPWLFVVPHPYGKPFWCQNDDEFQSIIERHYRLFRHEKAGPAQWKRDFYLFRLSA